MKFSELGDLCVLTLRNPESAVRYMRGLDLDQNTRWLVLLLAVSLSTLLAGLAGYLFPLPPGDPFSTLLSSPMSLAILQLGALSFSAAAITVIGRAFGGGGTFPDALLLIAWLELILVGLQAAQLVMMAIFPATGALMSIVALILSIYLTVALTKALHGFASTAKVAMTFVGGIFLMGFVLSLIAAAFGLLPEVTP